MRRIAVIGMSKSESHHVLFAKKEKTFADNFRLFLHDIGFKPYETTMILSLMGDADDNYMARRYSDRLYTDRYFEMKNKEFIVETFFGQAKVIISIFLLGKCQSKLREAIDRRMEIEKGPPGT